MAKGSYLDLDPRDQADMHDGEGFSLKEEPSYTKVENFFGEVFFFNYKYGLPPFSDPSFAVKCSEFNGPISSLELMEMMEPRHLPPVDFFYKVGHLHEELGEILKAYEREDLVAFSDGLADLVYVAAGVAIFHGLPFTEHTGSWEDSILENDKDCFFNRNRAPYPMLPTPAVMEKFLDGVYRQLNQFLGARRANNMVDIEVSLYGICYICFLIAVQQRIPLSEIISGVHRANLEKVRVNSSDGNYKDSGRISPWDVVKPEGWEPFDVKACLREHGAIF